MTKIIVGPLLGFEGEDTYTVCFLAPTEARSGSVTVGERSCEASKIADLPDGGFWRADFQAPSSSGMSGAFKVYKVSIDNEVSEDAFGRCEWRFYVPAENEEPKIAYTSCNGVSKGDLIAKMERPFGLWEEMRAIHSKEPFSLLLMGGDQIYADSIWDKVKELEKWSSLKQTEQVTRKCTRKMAAQIDRFYSRLYVERWNQDQMSEMLASIPSIMMWDDHDIFDGWGSFPEHLQRCDVFSGVFRAARKYFELFQLRGTKNASLLSEDGLHYSTCTKFRNYSILALDNRTERSIHQIMSSTHWTDILDRLKPLKSGNLALMSAVPVVYRDFSLTETVFDVTPWDENLTDDLKDHWRAKEHQGERSRLIMNLLKNAAERKAADKNSKTVILSGDVHVGCLGVITDKRNQDTIKVHQVVSSGIVHPAPSLIAWLGIEAVTNDDAEALNEDRTIEAHMLKPFGSEKYIRSRNFVTLHRGNDNKIWVNWVTEAEENPEYPVN